MGNITVGKIIQTVRDAEIAEAKLDLAYKSLTPELETLNENVSGALRFAKGTIVQLKGLLEDISL